MPEPETTPPAQLRCVCGDPVERWTGPGEPGWVHSPGSDTTCVDARPRCPHCGLPHDLDPAGLPARVCAMARTQEYRASIKAIPPDYQLAPAEPVPGLRDQIAGAARHAADSAYGNTPFIDAITDAVLAVVQPAIDEVDLLRRGATERSALLEEARDALSAAGQNGAHGDDWPAIAPSIRALGERAGQAGSALTRVRDRCQGVRDRVGPGGMINASQILGLLSPTWPDGNYEAALTPPVPADQPEGGVG